MLFAIRHSAKFAIFGIEDNAGAKIDFECLGVHGHALVMAVNETCLGIFGHFDFRSVDKTEAVQRLIFYRIKGREITACGERRFVFEFDGSFSGSKNRQVVAEVVTKNGVGAVGMGNSGAEVGAAMESGDTDASRGVYNFCFAFAEDG
jgi:hypothetical protein